MNKIMRLIRVRLMTVLSDTLSIGKNRNKKPKMLIGGIAFFALIMSFVSFTYCMLIGVGLKMFDSLALLPALVMAVTCFLVFTTTIFKVKGTIFAFRDYDMVMSLPVSTSAIAISRLIILYVLNILFVLILMVPMMIAYGFLAAPPLLFYVLGAVSIFVVPLVPIILASFIGTGIAYISTKFRRSHLVNLVLSLLFFCAIVASSFLIQGDEKELLNIATIITNRVNQIYPLAPYYARGIVDFDLAAFMIFSGISLGTFLLYTFFFQKTFKRINSLMMRGTTSVNYKMGELRTSSPVKALYLKELKRYFSSTLYVLNTGFAVVMLTIGTIALFFVDMQKVFGSAEAVQAFIKYIPLYVVFSVLFSCTTMVSISLEGKNLWILKSMPIKPQEIFLSKIGVNLTILMPCIIDGIIIAFILRIDFLQTVLLLFTAVACAILISLYGIIINLLLPNFNWTAEVTVVKQSAATMITIFSGMGYAALLFVFFAVIPSVLLAYLAYLFLTITIACIFYKVIMSYGIKRYYSF